MPPAVDTTGLPTGDQGAQKPSSSLLPAGRAYTRRRALAVLLACVALLLSWVLGTPAAPAEEAVPLPVTAYFVDVGQGDCEFVVLPDGQTMLIDGGDPAHGDAALSFVRDTLDCDHIDYLVATHPHADHIGGLPTVLRSGIAVGQVYAPPVETNTASYDELAAALAETGHEPLPAVEGTVIYDAYGCRVEVLAPDPGDAHADLNDWSAVVYVTYGETSFLFTGDAGCEVLEALPIEGTTVFKVGHHGSDTSTTLDLIGRFAPQVAVIEVGAGNDYGLPSQETLDELAYWGVQTWRTDVDATVAVQSDGTGVRAWSLATGATEPSDPAVVATYPDAPPAAEAGVAAESGDLPAEMGAAALAPSGITVYVTETGNKYHGAGCRYLKSSKIAIDRDEAVSQGYDPCKVCGG